MYTFFNLVREMEYFLILHHVENNFTLPRLLHDIRI